MITVEERRKVVGFVFVLLLGAVVVGGGLERYVFSVPPKRDSPTVVGWAFVTSWPPPSPASNELRLSVTRDQCERARMAELTRNRDHHKDLQRFGRCEPWMVVREKD